MITSTQQLSLKQTLIIIIIIYTISILLKDPNCALESNAGFLRLIHTWSISNTPLQHKLLIQRGLASIHPCLAWRGNLIQSRIVLVPSLSDPLAVLVFEPLLGLLGLLCFSFRFLSETGKRVTMWTEALPLLPSSPIIFFMWSIFLRKTLGSAINSYDLLDIFIFFTHQYCYILFVQMSPHYRIGYAVDWYGFDCFVIHLCNFMNLSSEFLHLDFKCFF